MANSKKSTGSIKKTNPAKPVKSTAVKAEIKKKMAEAGVGEYAPKPAPKGDAAKSGMGGKVAKGSKNPISKLVNKVKRGK